MKTKKTTNNTISDFLDIRTFAGKEKTDNMYKKHLDEIIDFEMKYF